MIKTIRHAGRTLPVLCAVTMVLAGCAVERERQTQGNAAGDASSLSSPAREQVHAGFAEMVLTNRPWPSFEEASAHRITSVTDGSPLYANIRTARPMGELALPADPNGRYAFSAYPHLYLHVGDDEGLRTLTTCYITLAPAETRLRELVVPLAPLA